MTGEMGSVGLHEISDVAAELKIGDTTYPMRRLKPSDYAAAKQRMQDGWRNGLIASLRNVPLENDVLGRALADVSCRPITVKNLWDDVDSEHFLMYRSLQVNGKGPTLDQVTDKMPTLTRRILSRALVWAAGLPLPMEENTDRPLATTGSGSSSEASATNDGI